MSKHAKSLGGNDKVLIAILIGVFLLSVLANLILFLNIK